MNKLRYCEREEGGGISLVDLAERIEFHPLWAFKVQGSHQRQKKLLIVMVQVNAVFAT